jgi:hypothetical protein
MGMTIVSKDTSGQETGRIDLKGAAVTLLSYSGNEALALYKGIWIGRILDGINIYIHFLHKNKQSKKIIYLFTIKEDVPSDWGTNLDKASTGTENLKAFESIIPAMSKTKKPVHREIVDIILTTELGPLALQLEEFRSINLDDLYKKTRETYRIIDKTIEMFQKANPQAKWIFKKIELEEG